MTFVILVLLCGLLAWFLFFAICLIQVGNSEVNYKRQWNKTEQFNRARKAFDKWIK